MQRYSKQALIKNGFQVAEVGKNAYFTPVQQHENFIREECIKYFGSLDGVVHEERKTELLLDPSTGLPNTVHFFKKNPSEFMLTYELHTYRKRNGKLLKGVPYAWKIQMKNRFAGSIGSDAEKLFNIIN